MATFRPERRETLQEVWEDLRAQTCQDWEWLIVTDGPEGPLANWVDRLDDARVRLLGTAESHHMFKALGMRYAGYVQKAEGVRRARGALIAQVDDDNRIYPTYLERLSRAIVDGGLDFAICSIKTDYPTVPFIRPHPPFPPFTSAGFDVLCMMIRRELIERVGGWPEYGGVIEPHGKLADDGRLLQIIVETGHYIILDEVLAYHRTVRRLQPDATA